MNDNSLQKFVAHAREKGMDYATIRMLLLANGWKERDVVRVLSSEELDMPVPVPPDTGGAREAFFHLLTFGALYTTLISIIVLYFTYLHRLFPDIALERYTDGTFVLSSIRRAMAAVIVGFPLLLLFTRHLVGEMREHPERAVSSIRRWLTYLTLLVAASSLVGTLITVVYYLLEGELSMRFILKVLTVVVVAGLTFTYYLLSLRTDPRQKHFQQVQRLFLILSSLLVGAALVWGAFIIGTPTQERLRKIDEQRVEDLRAISSEMYNFVYGGRQYDPESAIVRSLPENLEALLLDARYRRLRITDPATGAPYGYTVLGEKRFDLCAVFDHERAYDYDVFWDHPAGPYCYSFDLERQRF